MWFAYSIARCTSGFFEAAMHSRAARAHTTAAMIAFVCMIVLISMMGGCESLLPSAGFVQTRQPSAGQDVLRR